MILEVVLPDTADPGLIDQLTAAVTRMGGHVQPGATPPGELGPDDGSMPPEGLPGEPMALGPEGGPAPLPPGMEQQEPMGPPTSGVRRPASLRPPRPKGASPER